MLQVLLLPAKSRAYWGFHWQTNGVKRLRERVSIDRGAKLTKTTFLWRSTRVSERVQVSGGGD